jgi:hypothetical protein
MFVRLFLCIIIVMLIYAMLNIHTFETTNKNNNSWYEIILRCVWWVLNIIIIYLWFSYNRWILINDSELRNYNGDEYKIIPNWFVYISFVYTHHINTRPIIILEINHAKKIIFPLYFVLDLNYIHHTFNIYV